MIKLLCLSFLFVPLLGFAHAQSKPPSDWQNRRWLEKTVRVLRGGDGLLPTEDADALLRLPREESDETAQFVHLIAQVFKLNVARSAQWSFTSYNLDTHDSTSARQQPVVFKEIAERIARIFRLLNDTPYDDKALAFGRHDGDDRFRIRTYHANWKCSGRSNWHQSLT